MYSRQANIVHHVHGFGHIPRNRYTPQVLFFSSPFSIHHPSPISTWHLWSKQHCTVSLKHQAQGLQKAAAPSQPAPASPCCCIQCLSAPLLPVPPPSLASDRAHSTTTLTRLPTPSQPRAEEHKLRQSILRNSLLEATKGCKSNFITKRRVPIWVRVQFPEWHYPCSVNSLLFKGLLTVHICTNVFMLHSFQVNNNGFLLLIIHEPFCPIIMKF